MARTERPRKRRPSEINRPPRRLSLPEEDWAELERGIDLFNKGQFWNAHEAWEEVWKRLHDDGRLFLQGLIQLAAAYHDAVRKRSYRGFLNNLDKALEKLKVFAPEYLGVSVESIMGDIARNRTEILHQGEAILDRFDRRLVPTISFHKPANPDLLVAVTEVIRSAEFREGARLFNTGYFWDAHELWEEQWRSQEGDAKVFLEGFVQLASAYNFLRLNRQDHTLYLLQKARHGLERFLQSASGVSLKPIIDHVVSTCSALETADPNGDRAAVLRHVPTIRLSE